MLQRIPFPIGVTLPSGRIGFFLCCGKGHKHLQVTIHPEDTNDVIVTEHIDCCGHGAGSVPTEPVTLENLSEAIRTQVLRFYQREMIEVAT